MIMKPGYKFIQAGDGTKICYREFSRTGKPKAVLLIIQGSGGGSEEDYCGFAEKLSSRGFTVIRADERGTGGSEGTRGDIQNFDTVIGDYKLLAEALMHGFAGKKLFLMGHSFGGIVAARAASELKEKVSGVVLLNPMFGYNKKYGPSVRDIAYFIFCMIFKRTKAVYNISGDPARIRYVPDREEAVKNQSDPRIVNRFSIRYLMTTKKLIDRAEDYCARDNIPMLLVRGEEDDFVDKEKTARIFNNWPEQDKREIVLENAGHGVYTADLAADSILSWLEQHL